ncbi:NAD-binding protein [Amylostereum chailletii]|nr:NAD-binding protein [Amylostereum chailletii]
MTSVFYIGATGYIGGSVLVSLIKQYPSWNVNALVRGEKYFEPVRALGVTVIHGTFSDESLIAEQARAADIVINAADSDHVQLNAAILVGMKQRFDEGKPKGILIHTSGVSNFHDGTTEGKYNPDCRVWNDARENDIKDINTSQMHGHVDVPILKAGEEGYVNAYIVCPSGVVGATPADAPVKNGTILLKVVAQAYVEAKEAFYIGEGANEYQLVHIEDLVDYLMRVVDIAVNGKDEGASPYARYFIVTTGATTWKEIAEIAAERLHRRSILQNPTPRSVHVSEVQSCVSVSAWLGDGSS